MSKKCISCKSDVANDRESASLACPACAEPINRCGHCRRTGAQYKCSCNFEGP